MPDELPINPPDGLTAPMPAGSTPPTPSAPPPADVVEAARKLGANRPEAAINLGLALGFGGNPVQDKVTAEHITQSITLATTKEQNDYSLKKQAAAIGWRQSVSDRAFEVVILGTLVGVVVFTIEKFANQPTVLIPILTGIGGLFTGFLAGIGYGRTKSPAK